LAQITAGVGRKPIEYKWIALSNTTLGALLATINATSLIIALPAVFRGIGVNPLSGIGQAGLFLWVLMGFNVATTVLLVTFGRISDLFGRVRLYNLGFVIFTTGSILLSLTWGTGIAGEWQLIIFRFIQGIGGAFLFSNSAAILTDAFGPHERGFALGLNQVAAIGGSALGLVLGGILAVVDWRLVFLVNVPFGVLGTIWSYLRLKELQRPPEQKRIDTWGNLTFGVGITAVMVGLTYAILPYGGQMMGWGSPLVRTSIVGGVLLILIFIGIEGRVRDPMFPLDLFKSWPFSAGNVAGVLAALTRGGLQFMVVIWLQGIWLPLHGVSFANTPLQAGIDTLPQLAGFVVAGPLSGRLSDRYGARWFGFAGMVVAALAFYLLMLLPSDFSYPVFAVDLFLLGAGMGLFAAPNTTAIMNSAPARHRGVASGIRATFMNAGSMISMGVYFTIMIGALGARLPEALTRGLSHYGLPAAMIAKVAHVPPIAALFASLLGYNPMKIMVPPRILHSLSAHALATLTSREFFPNLLAPPFMEALRVVFLVSLVLSLVAGIASLLRGGRFVLEEETSGERAEIEDALSPDGASRAAHVAAVLATEGDPGARNEAFGVPRGESKPR